MTLKNKMIKIGLDYMMAILTLIFAVFLLPKLIVFFMPFFVGFIISSIANPIVKFLENKVKILRKHSTAVIIVLVIGLVVLLMYLLGSLLANEIYGLIQDLPEMVAGIKEQTEVYIDRFYDVYEKLPGGIQSYLMKIKDGIALPSDGANSLLSISNAGSAVRSVAEIILSVIFSILSAYFFTADRDILLDLAKKSIPDAIRTKISMIFSYFATAVGGYFKAQFKLMIIIIGILFVVFQIFGVHYSFLIALGIGVLDFLPVFGTGAVLWPWAAYLFLTGNYYFGVALVVLYFVCQLVKQFLQPKMVGDSIGLSPLTTLVLLFFGYKIGGLIGILIAIPIGLIIINLYRAGTFDVLIDDTKFIAHNIMKFCRNNKVNEDDYTE